MEIERYKGYEIWGHAIVRNDGFAASGTVTRNNELIHATDVLAVFPTEGQALAAGIEWGRAWIDCHQPPSGLP